MTTIADFPVAGRSPGRLWGGKGSYYLNSVRAYWRDARTVLDFLRVMQVRLALSKVGRLVCPNPVVAKVRLRTFGSRSLHLRSHTTDISVLNELLVSGGYDTLLKHPIRDARLIVDLGANTGLVDRWLLEQYPEARIIAVEPEPGNYAALGSNVVNLPVKTVAAAIGARRRSILLHTSTGEHGFTMVGEPPQGARAVEVQVVTMADVLDTTDEIDLLKVDIEGAEEELFSDCAEWIGRVRMLLVECHGAYTLNRLTEALAKAGGRFRILETEIKTEWGFEVGLFERI